MTKVLAATVVGLVALSTCANAGMNVPRHYPPPPVAGELGLLELPSSFHFDDGYRMFMEGDYRQAAKAFERALESSPGDYRAAYYLGMSHLRRSRYTQSRDAFRQALELGPDRLTASRIQVGLAYSYEAVRHTKRAHQHYHLACQLNKANDYAQIGSARTEHRHAKKVKKT